jgi:predicted nucleic acid-binding protein
MTAVFADTFFYLALLNPRDAAHQRALQISDDLKAPMLTSEFVLLEIADALASPHERPKFLELLDSLRASSSATIIPASNELLERGVALYRQRPDKDWPLTDCISFLVMDSYGVKDALTGDAHFVQAGYRALFL